MRWEDRRGSSIPPAAGGWVTSDGRVVELSANGVDVRRHDDVVARLEFDPRESEHDVVEAVAFEAAAEMDNVALRAELARQVELIRQSRARLSTAHLEERRRIERDLHDGAQQRLLAIALQLQSARLNGDVDVLVAETDRAITELQATVQELRASRPGCSPRPWPAVGCWLPSRTSPPGLPLAVSFDAVDERFPSDLESAAWFVVAEAVTNAVKHSAADRRGRSRAPLDGRIYVSRSVTKASAPQTPRAAASKGSPTGSRRSEARCGSPRRTRTGRSWQAVFPCAS